MTTELRRQNAIEWLTDRFGGLEAEHVEAVSTFAERIDSYLWALTWDGGFMVRSGDHKALSEEVLAKATAPAEESFELVVWKLEANSLREVELEIVDVKFLLR